MTKPHDKGGTTLPAFADQVLTLVRRAVEDVAIQTEAGVLHTLGSPLRLVHQEMLVLTARLLGLVSAGDFDGLDVSHFADPTCALIWSHLDAGATRAELAALLSATGRDGAALVAHLSDPTRLLLDLDVRGLVEQLIAAAAWRAFVDGVLLANADLRARAALGQRGVIDGPTLRARLRALSLDLVAGLEVQGG